MIRIFLLLLGTLSASYALAEISLEMRGQIRYTENPLSAKPFSVPVAIACIGSTPTFALETSGDGYKTLPDGRSVTLDKAELAAGTAYRVLRDRRTEREIAQLRYSTGAGGDHETTRFAAPLRSIRFADGREQRCVESNGLVYAGGGLEDLVTIHATSDRRLVLRHGSQTATDGRWSIGPDGKIAFTFLALDRVSIIRAGTVSRGLGVAANGEGWSTAPAIHFVATADALTSVRPAGDPNLPDILERLVTCRHFQGEASEDAERNRQIAQGRRTYRCETLVADHQAALATAYGIPDTSALRVLETFSPVR